MDEAKAYSFTNEGDLERIFKQAFVRGHLAALLDYSSTSQPNKKATRPLHVHFHSHVLTINCAPAVFAELTL